MMRFLLGFFVAALVFVPDKAINFIGAAAVTAKTVVDGVDRVTVDTIDRTKDELKRREIIE
jgi:hypothetical protein